MIRIKEWWAALDADECRWVKYYERWVKISVTMEDECCVCGYCPTNSSPCNACENKHDLLVHKANLAVWDIAWKLHHQVLIQITDPNDVDRTVRSYFVKANFPSYDYVEAIDTDRI